MSQSLRARFELEARRRREQQLARLREAARALFERFSAILDGLARTGQHRYIPDEYNRARQDLAELRADIERAPEMAQQASTRLGTYITGLPALAREAALQFEERTHQRVRELEEQSRQAKSAIAALFIGELQSIQDPIVRDFAYDGIRAFQLSCESRGLSAAQFEAEKEGMRQQIQAIRAAAEQKAVAWKQQKQAEVQPAAQKAFVEIHRQEIVRHIDENPRVLRNVLAGLDALQDRLSQGVTIEAAAVQEQVQAAAARADEAIVDERCRRETIKAVVQALQAADFVVEKPRRQKREETDEVVVLARKPSGRAAEFHVTLDGGLIYKFEQYEGMACKKDIEKVLPILEQVYGVKLSDERIIWQNPTPESRTARPITPGSEAHHHGS